MHRDEFCTRLLALRGPKYAAQTVTTCQGIYDLCTDTQPDYIVDVGTHYGTSTLVMALAMVHLGRSVSCITTLDRNHGMWSGTKELAAHLLYESGIDACQICMFNGDFLTAPFFKLPGHLLLFYDIHDNVPDAYPSPILVDRWLPQIKSGTVAIHDCVVARYEGQGLACAHHHSGLLISGGLECARVVNWLNKHGGAIHVSDAKAIYFEVRNGKPLP